MIVSKFVIFRPALMVGFGDGFVGLGIAKGRGLDYVPPSIEVFKDKRCQIFTYDLMTAEEGAQTKGF
jgi:hypothetical protein